MTALFIRGGKEKAVCAKQANLLLAKIGVLLAANLLLVRCPCTFDLRDASDANGSPGGDRFSVPWIGGAASAA